MYYLGVILFIPVLMIYLGIRSFGIATREISAVRGYGSVRSMKNKDTWHYSNRLAGLLHLLFGIVIGITASIFFL